MTDHTMTNTSAVRVSSHTHPLENGWDRWTVFTVDDDNEPSEEIDLDVLHGTHRSVIRGAAQYVLDRDYEPGLTIARLEQRFGLYM